MSLLTRALLLAATFGVATLPAVPAAAQAIQRCEGSDGKVTYSDGNCPAGTRRSRAVDTTPAVEPGAQKAARERARREAKALSDIEREREREQQAQQRLLEKAQARDEKCARLRMRVELASDELAGEKASAKRPPLQRKLERATREHELACTRR